ncbi:S-adenosyl-L-methionine-dependent methyltransferase [Basidiobolus meristosporus CBS 931.73]|uniref:rRNA adenine N(6)-methyltransferase n=1 Tax=Basidiobolus meristosporus CBS 931.73 TaxID=1314790 RepID=A0A1Y1Z6B2_9FUNG|nr:S-adenosyl-L-methionine-dependent methyltransferase [Basidiobolus meristosporus CBS 931.73]|eukprot:ORY05345.1 S-adenosyl-L-methionine-dependent methyltransferase [Basidiobolus meristosporus CBS 931.73]
MRPPVQLPPLPAVRDLIKIYGLTARQQLSQNFILDRNVTDKIIKTANLDLNQSLVVEVGPGPGLLTRSILGAGARNVVVVEKDDRFLPTLNQLSDATGNRLKVIQGDMLTLDHKDILKRVGISSIKDAKEINSVHLVGNLPFNIASPLLIQWLKMVSKREGIFEFRNISMTLMFQKEVGERIAAPTSTRDRGRISIMAQSICNVKKTYNVPASVFVPKPKVDACVVQLLPKYDHVDFSYSTLEVVARFFFAKRRKTVARIIKDFDKELLELLPLAGMEDSQRPEDVTAEQFIKFTNLLESRGIQLP